MGKFMFTVKLQTALLATSLFLFVPPAVLTPPTVLAQSNTRTQRVQFKPGVKSATIKGSIKGYQTVDYALNARKGQTMNVSMATKHGGTYFNILAPGETEVAMFNGSINGNQYEGTLSKSGDYKIRVYMMRSAARRNEVANYRLEMIVSTPGTSGADVKVPGTNYNATGNVPCSMGGGQPSVSCSFGVTRQGNGSGIVTVKKPDGRTRAIFFTSGKATGYDQNQADPGGTFSAIKQSDLNIISIGQERYEIPDAVIFGG